jgi:hypothetical protein
MFPRNILPSLAFTLVGLLVALTDINTSSVEAATVETIATGLPMPYGITKDNDDVIVTVNGSLLRIDPLGNVQTITPLTSGIPSDVLVHNSEFIVVENPTASLLRISQSGVINTIATNLGDPVGVAIQGNDFIIGDFGLGTGSLKRTTSSGNVSNIASNGVGGLTEIVVDGDDFWVTDFTFGRLLFITANGDVTEIATGLGQPLDIEFNGEDFLITDFADGFNTPGNGRILRVSKTGQIKTLIDNIGNPSGLAIDGDDLLFTDIVDGRVAIIKDILAPQSVPEPSSISALFLIGTLGLIIIFNREVKV